MAVTFDSVTLQKPRIESVSYPGTLTKRKVLDGRFSLKSNANVGFTVRFKCYTASYTDIDNIRAKVGTVGTLTVGATNYTNCMISPPIEVKPNENFKQWFYYVTIEKDTTL